MEKIAALAGFIIGLRAGLVAALFMAVIFYNIARMLRGSFSSPKPSRGSGRYGGREGNNERAHDFCIAAGAMFAKMAKADGRISKEEIASVERSFLKLGFSPESRRVAIEAFRRAKYDSRTIYDCARDFAMAARSRELRELLYLLLWDLAVADGDVSKEEEAILQRIIGSLRIAMEWYYICSNEYLGTHYGGADSGRGGGAASNDLAEAYAIIGTTASASDAEIKKAYREKAKKYHPDVLRAQGLPEEMIGKANVQMARINEAWSRIRASRGL